LGDAPLTVGGWALGRRIRRYRDAAGITAERLAKMLKVSQPTVTRIEKGRHRLTHKQLTDVCKGLNIDPAEAAALEVARQEAQQPDWRQDYQNIIDGLLGDVLGLESGAARIRAYDASFVPGLLQTEEYARAVMREMPYVRESQIRRQVELRMRRQEGVLTGRQHLVAVVNWHALVQEVGGADVMRRQIRHLRECAHRENIMFRVAPRSAGAYAGYGTSYTILDFDHDIDLPTVVCSDTLISSLIYEQPGKVETYTQSFDMMWPTVLGEPETLDYLDTVEADH
jgi:transcriptional regulator with XRE-family HTH domain